MNPIIRTGKSSMTPSTPRKSNRALSTEELDRLRRYRQQVAQDVSELRQEARDMESQQRAQAMEEPTVSGQLRRAIAESGLELQALAQQLGLPGKTLAEFLVGVCPLDSVSIDKLAAILHQELKPIG
jgi:hypothetical protein